MKRLFAILLAVAMVLSLCACAGEQSVEVTTPQQTQAPVPESYENYDVRSYASEWVYHDVCYVGAGEAKYVDVPYYSLENVTYCTNPVDEVHQTFNIYVPACYMTQNADGTCQINEKGIFGVMGEDDSTIMYGTQEAPIVYLNTISGYAAGVAPKISDGRMGSNAGYCYQFIEQGLILVTVSARGRTSTDADGNCNGTAPNGLVDLKAGIRWLTYNDEFLAGDSNKIVTIGVSAGGGMSTMLGASGNSELYDSYLTEIGALDSSDAVWASVAYCPITDLEFADGVYWWQMGAKEGEDFEAALTNALRDEYIAYMQSMGFDLGDDGVSGSFYEEFLNAIEEAFTYHAVNNLKKEDKIAEYFASLNEKEQWISYNAETGTEIVSLEAFVNNYWGEKLFDKGATVFDTFDCGSMEGEVFGGKHFSWIVVKALEKISGDYPEAADYLAAYKADVDGGMGDIAALYDPMTFVGQDNSDVAPHWRFNIGTEDTNIAHALAWTVYNALNAKEEVDANYAILHGIGHQTVEYDPYDLISWIYKTDLGVAPAYDNIKSMQTVDNGESAGAVQSYDSVAGTYTLTEVNAVGMEVSWTLELGLDGKYVLSETGVVEKSYTGSYVAIDGYISCGPINEEEGPRGEAFGDGYISVWTVNSGAGTCAHADLSKYTDPATAGTSGGAVDVSGTYTLEEVNAVGMEITWTLVLNPDGTYALSEVGVVEKTYTGNYGYADGLVSCGPINEEDGPRGEAFGDGFISVWTVDPANGTCAYTDVSKYQEPGAAAGAAVDVSGEYTLEEVNAVGMEITWTLLLNPDGTYALSETGVVDKTYTGNYGYANGFVSCGPINEADGPRGEAFGDGFISVWTVDAASGTCAYVDLGNYTAPAAAGAATEKGVDVVGIYDLTEVNAVGMEIAWTLELRADKTYVLSETGVVEKSYTGVYTNDGTIVSCGPINEEDGPRGEAFGDSYISVWSVNPEDGTCTHEALGKYVAP